MNDLIEEVEETEEERAERIKAEAAVRKLRSSAALRSAPDLAEHVRAIATSSKTERGETLPEWSSPMRITAVDDLDEMFAKLVEWVLFWSSALESQETATAFAWTRLQAESEERQPVGFRAETTPLGASLLVKSQTIWLLGRADRIAEHETARVYQQDVIDTVWALRAKYPTAPRPPKQVSPRPCSECGEFAVGAEWKSADVLDVVVACDYCGAKLATLPAQVAKWLDEDDSPLVLSAECVLAQHGACESVHCECPCHRSHDSGASS